MKQLKSICLLLMVAFLPLSLYANEQEEEKLDIPEIVLEHLADSYEWHIASYQGKHISIPLPIIIRSASDNPGQSGSSAPLTVCPSSSSSARNITARYMSVWEARRFVHWI